MDRLDFEIRHRGALAGKAGISRAGFSLRALPEGHVLQVMAKAGQEAAKDDIAVRIDALAGDRCGPCRFVAPGHWFLAGDRVFPADELSGLMADLSPVADLVDQSHGRVRLALNGANAVQVLAKGCGVDFALPEFPIGKSTTTLCGHIPAHVTRMETEAFELLVLRGFAQSLWDDLDAMSAEFA